MGISVDVRTRSAGDEEPVDAEASFGDALPQGDQHRAGEARLHAIHKAAPTTVSQEPSPVATSSS